METTTRDERYHVVCRRCTTERVFDAEDPADEFATRHGEETGHLIVVKRVD